MLTLHHLEYSQSFRVLWLLEELQIPYQLKKYNRDPDSRLAPEDYKRISPLGTAPVITDGSITLAETGAIVDYIIETYANNRMNPQPGSKDRIRHLFWMHASQASMMPILMMDSLLRIATARSPALFRPVLKAVFNKLGEAFSRPRMNAILAKAEQELQDQPWFGGESLSSADILMSYPMESARARGYITDSHSNCCQWLQTVYERDAFKAAKNKDGRECMVLPL